MSDLRERVRELLDTLDGIGVDPLEVRALRYPTNGRQELFVGLETCSGYEAACRALKAKPDPGRSSSRSHHRIRDSFANDLVIVHHCFTHLDCWRAA